MFFYREIIRTPQSYLYNPVYWNYLLNSGNQLLLFLMHIRTLVLTVSGSPFSLNY